MIVSSIGQGHEADKEFHSISDELEILPFERRVLSRKVEAGGEVGNLTLHGELQRFPLR